MNMKLPEIIGSLGGDRKSHTPKSFVYLLLTPLQRRFFILGLNSKL